MFILSIYIIMQMTYSTGVLLGLNLKKIPNACTNSVNIQENIQAYCNLCYRSIWIRLMWISIGKKEKQNNNQKTV